MHKRERITPNNREKTQETTSITDKRFKINKDQHQNCLNNVTDLNIQSAIKFLNSIRLEETSPIQAFKILEHLKNQYNIGK